MQPHNIDMSNGLSNPPTIPSSETLDQRQYPKIRYWFKQAWTDQQKQDIGMTKVGKSSTRAGGKKSTPGQNVTMRYVEDQFGVVVDGYRASEMRKCARSIWNCLAQSGKAPKKWGKVDVETARQYRREMCLRFPELRLCAYDWKADQIATDNYPNWALHNLENHVVKEEDGDPRLLSVKRRELSEVPEPAGKKMRIASPAPSVTNSIDDHSDYSMMSSNRCLVPPTTSTFTQEKTALKIGDTTLQHATTASRSNTPALTVSPPSDDWELSTSVNGTTAHERESETPARINTDQDPEGSSDMQVGMLMGSVGTSAHPAPSLQSAFSGHVRVAILI